MKTAIRPILTLSLFAAVAAFGYDDTAPAGAPQADSLEPKAGKAGSILRVVGKSLSKPNVDEVYLTDHRFDLKVKVLEQTDTHIAFRIPPFVKPGRLQLLLLTGGKNPLFLEQPFYVQIEDGEDTSLPAPVPVTKGKPAKTVEVASAGAKIPVPPAPAPAPMTSEPAPKKTVAATSTPKQENKPVEVARVIPQAAVAVPVQSPIPQTLEPQQQPQAPQPVVPQTAAPVAPPAASSEVEVVPAQVIRRTRVAYPAGASTNKVEGAVELVATVRADGHVKDVRVVKGNPFLAAAALSSVREWLYEPARLNGRAVESQVNVVLNFKRPQ